jgi:hypothetical protein
VARRKTRDLEIVVHAMFGGGQRVVLAFEELFLKVIPWPPREHRSDVEIFANDMADHVIGLHADRRCLVMQAPCRVDVMVAGVPPESCQINPSLERERERLGPLHLQGVAFDQVFGPSRELDRIFTCG